MSKTCSVCHKSLDRRNTSGTCKRCNPITGAASQNCNSGDTTKLEAKGDDAVLTTLSRAPVRSLEDLIEVCQIDTEVWEVERWVANKWEMGAKTPDGHVSTTPLFQVKAWLRRRTALIDAREELTELKALAKTGLPRQHGIATPRARNAGYLLEIPVTDPHFGKLAWGPETGGAHYDLKEAERRFVASIDTLLQRTAQFHYERILLVLGGDLFHVDNKQNQTYKGTPLDVDSRQPKTFSVVRTLMLQTIDRLRAMAPVDVVIVPGNHDTSSIWHLGDSLASWYHDTPGVTVDNTPTSRKYYRFGANLLLFYHGDKGKRADYPLLMATERSKDFGETRFREVHTGHLHHTRVQEHRGVRVRILPALCPPDAWHAENAMVGNVEGAEAFVWSKTEGLVSQAFFTVV